MYASPESRDADIAEGARAPGRRPGRGPGGVGRPPGRDGTRLAGTAPGTREVRDARRAGRARSRPAHPAAAGGRVPPRRPRPWATPSPTPTPGSSRRTLRRAVATLADSPAAPSLRLRSEEGDVWSVGDGAMYVTRNRAGLLLWLARGVPRTGSAATGRCRPVPPWDDVRTAVPDRRWTGQASADSRLTPALRARATAPSARHVRLGQDPLHARGTVSGETLSSSPIWVGTARPSAVEDVALTVGQPADRLLLEARRPGRPRTGTSAPW